MDARDPQRVGLLLLGTGLAYAVVVTVWTVGLFVWLWKGFLVGSLAMFCLGLFPWTAILVAPVGFWALFEGWPGWVIRTFT